MPTWRFSRRSCQFSKENFPRIDFDGAKDSGAHPRVFIEPLSEDPLVGSIEDEHRPMFRVFQWTTKNYKMSVSESVHKHGMFVPPFLISHRPLLIPRWSLLVDHDEVRHFPTSVLPIGPNWFHIILASRNRFFMN